MLNRNITAPGCVPTAPLCAPRARIPTQREYRIAGVDELIKLVLELIEGLRREAQEGPYPVAAAGRSGHERTRIYHEHDFGVHVRPQRFPGPVPVVGEALDDLQVLLRHRPPSIAPPGIRVTARPDLSQV